jgi:hypothetical protein
VEVKGVVLSTVESRDDERLPFDLEADMSQETGVEDGV